MTPLAERACFPQVADSRLVAVAMKFVVVSPEDAHKAEREAGLDEGLLPLCLPHSRLYGESL